MSGGVTWRGTHLAVLSRGLPWRNVAETGPEQPGPRREAGDRKGGTSSFPWQRGLLRGQGHRTIHSAALGAGRDWRAEMLMILCFYGLCSSGSWSPAFSLSSSQQVLKLPEFKILF